MFERRAFLLCKSAITSCVGEAPEKTSGTCMRVSTTLCLVARYEVLCSFAASLPSRCFVTRTVTLLRREQWDAITALAPLFLTAWQKIAEPHYRLGQGAVWASRRTGKRTKRQRKVQAMGKTEDGFPIPLFSPRWLRPLLLVRSPPIPTSELTKLRGIGRRLSAHSRSCSSLIWGAMLPIFPDKGVLALNQDTASGWPAFVVQHLRKRPKRLSWLGRGLHEPCAAQASLFWTS